MAHSPFESNTQVKRKIEPADGLSLWFAEVPEGGITENTYMFACVSSNFALGAIRGFRWPAILLPIPILTSAPFFVVGFQGKNRSSWLESTSTPSLLSVSRY